MIKRLLAAVIFTTACASYCVKPDSWKELFWAIEKNNLQLVSDFLKSNPPSALSETIFNHTNDNNETHLEYAFRTRVSFEIIQALLERNAPVRAGSTALHAAVESGNLQAADYVLSRGFNVNARDVADETPLDRALALKSRAAVLLLLMYNAEIPKYNSDLPLVGHIVQHLHPFEQRIVFSSIEDVSAYLELAERLQKLPTYAGRRPLLVQEDLDRALALAVGRGSIEKVRILLARNASRGQALRVVRGIIARFVDSLRITASTFFSEFRQFNEILAMLRPSEPFSPESSHFNRTVYPILGSRLASFRMIQGPQISRPWGLDNAFGLHHSFWPTLRPTVMVDQDSFDSLVRRVYTADQTQQPAAATQARLTDNPAAEAARTESAGAQNSPIRSFLTAADYEAAERELVAQNAIVPNPTSQATAQEPSTTRDVTGTSRPFEVQPTFIPRANAPPVPHDLYATPPQGITQFPTPQATRRLTRAPELSPEDLWLRAENSVRPLNTNPDNSHRDGPLHVYDLRYLPRASGEYPFPDIAGTREVEDRDTANYGNPLHEFDLNYLPQPLREDSAQMAQNQSPTHHTVPVSPHGLIYHLLIKLLSWDRRESHVPRPLRPLSDSITSLRTRVPTEQLIFVDDEAIPGHPRVEPVASGEMARVNENLRNEYLALIPPQRVTLGDASTLAAQNAHVPDYRYGLPSEQEYEATNAARTVQGEPVDHPMEQEEEFHAPDVTPYEHAVHHPIAQASQIWPAGLSEDFSDPNIL